MAMPCGLFLMMKETLAVFAVLHNYSHEPLLQHQHQASGAISTKTPARTGILEIALHYAHLDAVITLARSPVVKNHTSCICTTN